jgi:hypothetical protein
MHKLRCLHLSAAVLAFARAYWHGGPKRRTRRRAAVPASFGRTGCPTATAGQNRAAARIPAAHRIGRQRVKPAARHATISEAPTDSRTLEHRSRPEADISSGTVISAGAACWFSPLLPPEGSADGLRQLAQEFRARKRLGMSSGGWRRLSPSGRADDRSPE